MNYKDKKINTDELEAIIKELKSVQSKLSITEKQVLAKYLIEGQSQAQIAIELKVSLRSVRTILNKGLFGLKKSMNSEDYKKAHLILYGYKKGTDTSI